MIGLSMLRIGCGEGRSRQWYYIWVGTALVIPTVQRRRFCVGACLSGASSMAKEYQSKTGLNWIGLRSWPAACEECVE